MRKPTPKLKPPKFMVVYLCSKCGMDSGMSEREKPHCYYCDTKNPKNLSVISKKKLTPQVMAERMKQVNDRMMENLKKAYEISEPEDELPMLKTLDKADKVRKGVEKVFAKKSKK